MPKGSYRTPDIAAKMKATRIRNEAERANTARSAPPPTPYQAPPYILPRTPFQRPTYDAPGCTIHSIDGDL